VVTSSDGGDDIFDGGESGSSNNDAGKTSTQGGTSAGTGGNYNVLYKGKALDPIKPVLTLPEVVDESKWYGKEHRYADGEGKYVFAYLASPSDAQLAFNSTLVNPKEFKSYWDVTNPRWKGKIVSLEKCTNCKR
jgi:hypothetical protein